MSVASEISARGMAATWASQTIAFAILIRADEIGKRLEDPKSSQLVASLAWEYASILWEVTVRETHSDTDTATLMLAYSRKVFTYCDRQINR